MFLFNSNDHDDDKKKQIPKLFIFGESYAGKYIPSIAQKIIAEKNIYNL